jgi:hypothetical protein
MWPYNIFCDVNYLEMRGMDTEFLFGKREEERHIGRPRRTQEYNTKGP